MYEEKALFYVVSENFLIIESRMGPTAIELTIITAVERINVQLVAVEMNTAKNSK